MLYDNPSAIQGESYTFRRFNWKSSVSVIFITIFLFFYAVMIPLVIFSNRYSASMLLMGIFYAFAFFISAFLRDGFSKITIDPNGITCKSYTKVQHYSWMMIYDLGMLTKTRNWKTILRPNQYDEKFYFREKFIYISTSPNYVPEFFVRDDPKYLDFHYREKAWELMLYYTKNKNRSAYFYPPGGTWDFHHDFKIKK